jgi:hypothetical protein
MGVSWRTASVSANKNNIVPLCVLVNIPGKKKSLNKRFVETSAFAKILNCSVGCSVVQGQVKRCGRVVLASVCPSPLSPVRSWTASGKDFP